MKLIEAKHILEEGLKHYNLFYEHEIEPNEVIVYEKNNKWFVCAADERASIVDTSYTDFDNEEDALDHFIKLVRLEKILFR